MRINNSLTSRQELFCREFILDLNAKKAAVRAGYSKRTAKEIGYENLTKPHILKRIEILKNKNLEHVKNNHDLEISAEKVLREVALIAFSNIGDFLLLDSSGLLKLNPDTFLSEKIKGLKSFGIGQRVFIQEHETSIVRTEIINFSLTLVEKIKALDMLMRYLGLYEGTKNSVPLDLVERLQQGRERVRLLYLEQKSKANEVSPAFADQQ